MILAKWKSFARAKGQRSQEPIRVDSWQEENEIPSFGERARAKSRQSGLEQAILDVYEAVGGVDLAVLEGTRIALGVMPDSPTVDANIPLVGRDAIAVEAVGFAALGYDHEKRPAIKETMNRGLGEGNISKIKILGTPIEQLKENCEALLSAADKSKKPPPKKKSSV